MKKQNKKATPVEPVLIDCDQESINRQTTAVQNSLPLAQAVFDAWHAIRGVRPLDALAWNDLFMDTPSYIEAEKEHFYEVNYADSHKAIGIVNPEKGIELVKETLPNFDDVIAKIADYHSTWNQGFQLYAGHDAYTINENGDIEVSQAYVNRFTSGAKLIFSTQTELKAKTAVDNLVSALNAINESIPSHVFKLSNGGYGEADLNQLKELIEITHPQGVIEPDIKPKLNFYRKLHGVVVQQQLP